MQTVTVNTNIELTASVTLNTDEKAHESSCTVIVGENGCHLAK